MFPDELGKVELDDTNDGWTFRIHDKIRGDFISVAAGKGGIASAVSRGCVVFCPPEYIRVNAIRKGLTLLQLEHSMDLSTMPSIDNPNDAAPVTSLSRVRMNQWCRFSRNTAQVTPKIIYFYYQKIYFLPQSIQ